MNGNWRWVKKLHAVCVEELEEAKDIISPGEYAFYNALLSVCLESKSMLTGEHSIRKAQLILSDFVKWYNKK